MDRRTSPLRPVRPKGRCPAHRRRRHRAERRGRHRPAAGPDHGRLLLHGPVDLRRTERDRADPHHRHDTGPGRQAEEVVAAVEQSFADIRAANPGLAGREVAIDLVVDGVPYLLGADDLHTAVFAGIGTTVPDSTVELSPETIGQLDRDALVVLGANEADLTGDAVFQGLGAVADGRAVYVPGDGDFAGAVGFGNPLSLPYAAELITPQLAAVLG